MEQTDKTAYLEKVKDFYLKNKKLVFAAIGAIVVAVAGFSFLQSQPKSISSAVEVTFSGYDGYGTLEYNYEEINKEIARVSYRQAGFNSSQVKDLTNNDSVIFAEIDSNSALNSKYKKAVAMISSISYSFNKTSDLSNGDEVVFTVKTSSSKSPIKKETKKFKVKGLDKVQKISTKDFLKDYPVEFTGMNGYGKVVLPKDEDNNTLLTTSKDYSKLKNGDKVELTVSSDYLYQLKEDGKKLDSDTIEVEVSGLKELSEVGNIAEALAKNDTYAKSNYKNSEYTNYTLEKQKDYISYQSDWGESGQVYLVSVYKLTTVSTGFGSETTVEYVYYGYRYYVNEDNSLDLETANKVSGYETQDLANLTANLETDGYKEYTQK